MTTGATGRSVVAEYAARGVVLLVVAVAASARTWGRVVSEIGVGAGSPVLLAGPVGAALTLTVLVWFNRPELPIHDRQTDKIVGTVMMAIALMIQWLVLPRFAGTYVLLHLDIAAVWAFLFGGCVFVFGLRRTGKFWSAWLVLFGASPVVIRLATAVLGGGPWALACVVVIVVLVGPVGALIGARRRGRGRGASPWPGPAVTRREAWRSVPLLVLVAVVLALAPLPATAEQRLALGPPSLIGPGQAVPVGWSERSREDFGWATRVYGPAATLHRQFIRADQPRADWDPLRRPRQAVVQTLTVAHPGTFDAFPVEMTFDLRAARISAPVVVDLPHGVRARYRSVINDGELETWSLLSFVWTRGGVDRYQRVSILTVDDHDFDAQFPATVPGARSTASRLVALLLRGQASVTADDDELKDLDLLTELGSGLVEAQWSTR
ncbi:hypothetical protein [Dietzia sp. ANT_WB102]|uniref:hypothetical protein n=1 Tax=Dietzia sp. ANT_WB102 TaxID=2597345 RepID=UPI0011EFEE87|nr:hypothetical protein [Dietzia sp. ANT_WB102]KAA0919288.1 hypothetical protein FQ137_08550 [Dietzia sp. ANT_WB102]